MRTVADAFFETVQRWGTRPFLEILPETARAYAWLPATGKREPGQATGWG